MLVSDWSPDHQIGFTIVDDEFFHGGFSYYIKPYNRCQPYFIGLLLGIYLHKVQMIRYTINEIGKWDILTVSKKICLACVLCNKWSRWINDF